MTFALDADTSIEILRSRNSKVLSEYRSTDPGEIVIPSMVAAELLVGAEKSLRLNAMAETDAFFASHAILPFGEAEMREYARIRARLETSGMKIGGNDYVVAATALASNLTLVTHNTKEFSRVPGLSLVDWQV